MRRIAACKLFIAGKNEPLGRHIVEIAGEEGRMVNHFPLGEELPMTEWLGGVLLASPCCECHITHPQSINEVTEALDMTNGDARCHYIWHLSKINSETLEILPDCIFQRLDDEEDDDIF